MAGRPVARPGRPARRGVAGQRQLRRQVRIATAGLWLSISSRSMPWAQPLLHPNKPPRLTPGCCGRGISRAAAPSLRARPVVVRTSSALRQSFSSASPISSASLATSPHSRLGSESCMPPPEEASCRSCGFESEGGVGRRRFVVGGVHEAGGPHGRPRPRAPARARGGMFQ